PQAALQHAFVKLSRANELKNSDQMELAGLLARASAEGYNFAVLAAADVLEKINSVNRSELDPKLTPTLLNIILQGRDPWSAMNGIAQVILEANLTDQERSALVE